MDRIKHMLIKEFLQALRDPRMRLFIFGAPVIMLLVFGYAATNDVQHIATAVYDLDNSVASRELLSRFLQSNYFDVVAYVSDDLHAPVKCWTAARPAWCCASTAASKTTYAPDAPLNSKC